MKMLRPPVRQNGAALLTAMIIVALIATISSAMVWQQWRAVQVEIAERARMQAGWILAGALDWSKLILKEDAKSGKPTALSEPWAVPLAEARLSTFLAADKDNTVDDDGPEAFLSGSIEDAQARLNLRNLFDQPNNKIDANQLAILQRLFQSIGVDATLADRIGTGIQDALVPPGAPGASARPPLMPQHLDQLTWFGIDPATIKQISPYVVLLPVPTLVNVNTAPKEVLAAIANVDLGTAQRLVQFRQRTPFKTIEEANAQIGTTLDSLRVHCGMSAFFEVHGRLRVS